MGQLAGSEILRGALWIPVTGPALEAFQQATRRIRERVAGPGCAPHVTLLGGIEMKRLDAERRVRELAAGFVPFTIRTGRIDWYNEYHRALFARVEAGDELLAVRRRAMEVFNLNPHDPYEPHVSLWYGELPEAAKKELAAQLGGTIDQVFEARSIQLVSASRDVPVQEWRALAEAGLGATFAEA